MAPEMSTPPASRARTRNPGLARSEALQRRLHLPAARGLFARVGDVAVVGDAVLIGVRPTSPLKVEIARIGHVGVHAEDDAKEADEHRQHLPARQRLAFAGGFVVGNEIMGRHARSP